MKLGAHIAIARGIAWTAAEAIRLRCECIQIFLSNPRGWAPAVRGGEAEIAAWRRSLDAHQIAPIIGHASYLVNLASPDPQLRRKSVAAAAAAIRRGIALGSDRFIIPAGYHKGIGEAKARRLMGRELRALAEAAGGVRLLLENTAGAGSGMNWRFEDMAAALSEAGDEWKLGICLDTCHMHAAGYDLSGEEKVQQVLALFDRAVGLARLGAMHLNDAKYPAGSRRDAHTHIGKGTIGGAGFHALVADPRLAEVPGVIETPKEVGWDARNLRLLRRLRETPLQER